MCPDGSDPIERLVPGDSVPEPVVDKPAELTGEISALPPEEASKVAAEIRAVAELRGVDADVAELVELQKTGPLPIVKAEDDDALSSDELRDAWPLLDVVSFRDLFAADPNKIVAEVMETDVVRVTDEMDQETVSRIFAEHDLTVVPVVDKNGKMKGIVTVDDIVDVVQEEATEDAQ